MQSRSRFVGFHCYRLTLRQYQAQILPTATNSFFKTGYPHPHPYMNGMFFSLSLFNGYAAGRNAAAADDDVFPGRRLSSRLNFCLPRKLTIIIDEAAAGDNRRPRTQDHDYLRHPLPVSVNSSGETLLHTRQLWFPCLCSLPLLQGTPSPSNDITREGPRVALLNSSLFGPSRDTSVLSDACQKKTSP